jgi:hypothetical protein
MAKNNQANQKRNNIGILQMKEHSNKFKNSIQLKSLLVL